MKNCLSYNNFETSREKCIADIEEKIQYPLIAKPVDDGCSSAVKVIKNRAQLIAFAELMFRPNEDFGAEQRQILQLEAKEEFPMKDQILIEKLIDRAGAKHFLEITGGFLTSHKEGKLVYEMFEIPENVCIGVIKFCRNSTKHGELLNLRFYTH